MPKTVIEWLERQDELMDTTEVQLDYARNPKYPDVVAHRVGPRAANDNHEPAANDNHLPEDWRALLDSDIPF